MEVIINDKELIKLYETGESRKLKLPREIIDKFFATVQKIEAATSIYDLQKDKGLNFEKLRGSKSRYSMRLSIKYRLEAEVEWTNSQNTIGIFTLEEISNHYK